MKIFRNYLLISLSVLLLTAFTMEWKKETTLRLDIPKGTTVNMTTNMQMNYFRDKTLTNKVMGSNITIENQYSVTDRLGDGIHAIDFQINRVQLTQDMGPQSISYDSKNPESGGPMAAMIEQQLSGIMDTVISFKVNQLGKVVERPEMTAMGTVDMEQLTNQMFIKFPEKAISQGYSWSVNDTTNAATATIRSTTTYTVEEITKDQVKLKVDMEPTSITVNGEESNDLKLEQAGEMTFDKATGKMLSMSVNQTMTIPDPNQGGEMFMVNNIKIETK